MLRTHCQTSGVSLTEQDPYNNVIRTTIEAMAAVLGGTQSLHTNSLDEAVALPTDFSARIARNTQLVIAEESGITNVADPLGGSYYVEALTQRAGRQGLGADRGGRGAGRDDRRRSPQGMPKRRDRGGRGRARGAGRPRRDGDRRRQPLPARPRRIDLDILDIDNARVRAGQIARIERTRAERDEAKAQAALDALRARREGRRATCSRSAVEAARARCTLGEISLALEDAFGRYGTVPTPVQGIYGGAWADDPAWERAKDGVGAVGDRLGRKPRHAGRQDGAGRP